MSEEMSLATSENMSEQNVRKNARKYVRNGCQKYVKKGWQKICQTRMLEDTLERMSINMNIKIYIAEEIFIEM